MLLLLHRAILALFYICQNNLVRLFVYRDLNETSTIIPVPEKDSNEVLDAIVDSSIRPSLERRNLWRHFAPVDHLALIARKRVVEFDGLSVLH